MNTRHIYTRTVLSAALTAGVFFAAAPMQAQAPQSSINQTPQAKIESLQAQVQALQAQVKRLQAQLRTEAQRRAASPFPIIVPNYDMPNFSIPNYTVPNYTVPNFNGQGGFTPNPPIAAPPRLYSNIPPCQITLIDQKTR